LPINILIADDHKIMCDGLATLLKAEPDMVVVAQASNGREAVKLAGKFAPEIVILDVAMPDLNGIEAARQILSAHRFTKIIALSMHADRRYVTGMLSAGASGYLLKDCVFGDLVRAIRTVRSGQVYLSPSIAGIVVDELRHPRTQDYASRLAQKPLSSREREVLQLLAEGHSTQDIAKRLYLSVKTIETHRRKIMEKLGFQSIAQLIKYAIREGLTSLEK
jgi:DNA-binding NarL/FixJ family response regulator